MPIGIFLFSQKFELQKSEKNSEKRRKPEKISGFWLGIFFVKPCWRRHPESDRGIKVLQTSALPLGYGAVNNSAHRVEVCRFWSGLRGSNPPPRPWQGRALPNELNPLINGASGRNRTNDTGIFSPLLYRLSYRGICHKMKWRPGRDSNPRPLA